MLRLGVDGGGTSTRAVIIDENLQVLARGEAGSSNLYSGGFNRALENVLAAVDAAQQLAGVSSDTIHAWGLGLAGACGPEEQELWREHLLGRVGDARLVVDEDAAAAQAGAFGGGAGAVCIAGTGANCFGINGQGERARVDGLGPLLGDRGSGYWIGEQVLRAICRAADGCGPDTLLQPKVLAFLGSNSMEELVQTVYGTSWDKSHIAALVPVTLEAAQENDAVAQQILREAGTQLALSTLSVLQKLSLTRVAVSGGVLNRQSAVRENYEAMLHARLPSVSVEEPQFDAAMGAALLAPL
jgi:N-acetylglucosamine kinase-like BadF-type ATPase